MQGLQLGDGNTQINYYGRAPAVDGVALPPRVGFVGAIDSPYRGLNAFGERDAAFFYGRESAVSDVLRRLARSAASDNGMLVVSGASGAGKSSLLHAGMLPRLRGEGLESVAEPGSWPCVTLTPGRDPLDELAVGVGRLAGSDAGAIRRGLDADPARFALNVRQAVPEGQRLLFIVDQFEQLFTECGSDEERQAFVTALHSAATRRAASEPPVALVVVGMRADFEVRCLEYPELAEAVQDRYLLGPMTRRQLTMAITEPAKMAGASVDGDLVDVLLREASARQPELHEESARQPESASAAPGALRPGAASGSGVLPLLSHALDQAWRHRTGEALTLEDYERTGGIEAAIVGSAERALGRLTSRQQQVARQVFLRLTATNGDGANIIVRAQRAELTEGRDAAGAADVTAVLESFVTERFLTLDSGTAEISHEILLTAWPLLRDRWLGETQAERLVLSRLRGVADEWASHSRNSSYLYKGSLLETAEEVVQKADGEPGRYGRPGGTERTFLRTSRDAVRRATGLKRAAFAFVTALAVLLAFVTFNEVRATHTATVQRDLAVSQELASAARDLAGSDPDLAKQLAVTAYRIDPTSAAFTSLFGSQTDPGTISTAATGAAFSGDGSLLALLVGQRVELWGMTAHQIVAVLPPGVLATSLAFQPDSTGTGGRLAVGESDGQVELWDVTPAAGPGAAHVSMVAATAGTGSPVEQVAFSPAAFPGGQLMAAANWDHTVSLWDVARPGPPRRLAVVSAGSAAASSVAFAGGRAVLVTGDWDKTARLWNISNPRQPVLTGTIADGQVIRSLAVDSVGRSLAIGGDSVRLWNIGDPSAPQSLADLSAGAATAVTVAFDPDASVLMATGFNGGETYLWDTSNPASPVALPSLGGGGGFLATSGKGQLVATSGQAGSEVQLWNIADPYDRDSWSALPGTGTMAGYADSAIVSPNGRLLVMMTGGFAQLWDVANPGRPVRLGQVSDVAGTASFAYRDGRLLLATAGDEGVTLWNATDPARLSQVAEVPDSAFNIALSPDGQTLATIVSGSPGTVSVHLWSVQDPDHVVLLATLANTSDGVLAFGPGGQTLLDEGAAGDGIGDVTLWVTRDPDKPIPVTSLPSQISQASAVALSPAEPILAAGDKNGVIRLWNLSDPLHPSAIVTLSGDSAPQQEVVLSAEGDDLAGLDAQGDVQLWSSQDSWGATTVRTTSTSVQTSLSGGTLSSAPLGTAFLVIDTAQGSSLLDISPSDLIGRVCAQTGDQVTAQQWRQYVQGLPYQPPCRMTG